MPPQLTEADAWGLVMAEIRRIGIYGQPKFDDPVVAKTVKILDWLALCSSENVIADRAHFMKMYGQLSERAKDDAKLLPAAREVREIHAGSRTRLLTEANG